MAKLYVFGIGGTGSRVLRSLTMLLAAGVECGMDTIVPIIIDRDMSNKDLSRTKLLIQDYIKVHNIVEPKGKNQFFKTKIELLNNELCLQLKDKTEQFYEFIGAKKDVISEDNLALVKMLFSEETLNMDMTAGFQGNPNIGSVVLNQFDNSDIFKAFAADFNSSENKIFIISSIFGGTGASGFPLLRKVLQTPNQKDSQGRPLSNWGIVNNAHIGAISVLPYFQVKPATDDSQVDSDTFIDKAKAALSYYKQEDKKLDTLYYIADKRTTTYEHNKGGNAQRNNAHFVELVAALSILDFVNPQKKGDNIHRNDDNEIEETRYKEFGIKSDNTKINFDTLEDATKTLLVNPLSRFLLFSKYMGYYNVTERIENKEIIIECIKAENNTFEKERKYQPYAHKILYPNFSPIEELRKVFSQFCIWLYEMNNQTRKFSPFNLTTENAFDFIEGEIKDIVISNKGMFSNWAKVDNELNRQSRNVKNKKSEPQKYFLELFYLATEALLNFKLSNAKNK